MSQDPLEQRGINAPRVPRRAQPIPDLPTADTRVVDIPSPRLVSTDGERMAVQLEQAMQGFAGVATQLGNQAVIEQNRQERAQARSERDAEKAAHEAERAQAKEDAADRISAAAVRNVDLATLSHDIAQNKIVVPDGMKIEDYAINLVHAQRGADHSDEFAREYDEMLPHVVRALYDQQDRFQAVNKKNALAAASDQAMWATDSAGVQKAVDDAKTLYPNAPEVEIYDAIVKPAVENAALAGDRGRLDAALATLGDRMPDVRRKAEAQYASAKAHQNGLIVDGFRNDVSALLDAGVAHSAIDAKIDEYKKAGKVPATDIDIQRQRVRERFAEQERKNLHAIADADENQKRQGLLAAAEMAFDAGVPFPREVTIARIDGQADKTFKLQDAVDAIGDKRVGLANTQFPIDKMPAENMAARVRIMNGLPSYVDQDYQARISGISGQIASNTTRENIPGRAIKGFELFRDLGAMSPSVRDRVTPESDREFLRTAQFLQEKMKLDPAEAMARISQVKGRPLLTNVTTTSLSSADEKKLRSVIGSVANAEGIYREASDIAKAYSVYFDAPMATAIEFASQRIREDYTTIGERKVRTVGRSIANLDMPAVADAIIGSFKATHREFANERLSLDAGNGSWRVISDAGLPVGSMAFSDDDLAAINARMRAHDNEKKIAEVQTEAIRQAAIRDDSVVKMFKAWNFGGSAAVRGWFIDAPKTIEPATPPRPQDRDYLGPVFDYIDGQRKGKGPTGSPPSSRLHESRPLSDEAIRAIEENQDKKGFGG